MGLKGEIAFTATIKDLSRLSLGVSMIFIDLGQSAHN